MDRFSRHPLLLAALALLAFGAESCALFRADERKLVVDAAGVGRGLASGPSENAALESFVGDLNAKLPQALLSAASEGTSPESTFLHVRWQSGRSIASTHELCQSKVTLHGLANFDEDHGTIALNPELKTILLQGKAVPQPLPCSAHQDAYELAQAAVVHQLGHAYYDRVLASRGLKPWQKRRVRRAPKWVSADHYRSLDPLEGVDESERFATNLEYLVLDPQFACRRPFEARWIAGVLEDDSLQARVESCEPQWTVEAEDGTRVDLKPSKVREIRYLYVKKGAHAFRSGGHAMFLIRGESGEFALSFRANILEPVPYALARLKGTRVARVYLYPFSRIREEYAVQDLRDLTSAPLVLTQAEKESLLALALERYWAGGGRYVVGRPYSGVEARDFLKEALSATRPELTIYAARPDALQANLLQLGLLDRWKIEHVRSDRKQLETAWNELTELSHAKWKSLDEYFEKSTAEERMSWARQVVKTASDRSLPLPVAELNALETKIRDHLMRMSYRQATAKLVDYRQRGPDAKEALAGISYLRELAREQTPAERIRYLPGYGVPLASELAQRGIASQLDGNADPDSQQKAHQALRSLERHWKSASADLGVELRDSMANSEIFDGWNDGFSDRR